jgi:hypothetical protein
MSNKFFLLFLLFAYTVCHAQHTQIHYLSGTDKDHTVSWDFMCSSGRNSGGWSKIPVPSNWELQGFGNFNYGYEKNDGEDGFYRHTFKTLPSWKNKLVKIVFEGSMTDTEVKINGELAGPMHQGAFYRFKYDITELLNKEGDNLLEVTVHKVSSDTSVNRAERMADYWVFGGIFRPVYLEIVPVQHISWTAIDAKADGSFLVNLYPENLDAGTVAEARIKTLDGKTVGQASSDGIPNRDGKITIRTRVNGIKTWTPETPNRYQVEISLKTPKGVIHAITEKFGFRTVTFEPGQGFFVNGKKIIFKGVNRHSSWPTSGKTMSKELSILDINLMKDMNMNAVRMSHYPPDDHFLDACDSLGLFVLDELGGWQKKYDTPVGRKLVKEMLMKDVNHPSIIIWDNGNEGGNNFELDDEFALYDPQKRHVIHPWNIFRETDTQHYKAYGCCAGTLYNGSLVFFPTEMLHGLFDGGHGAGLDDHWKLMLENPLSAGGFLWVLADEGVVRSDMNGAIDVKGNRAPDGIVGPFREKEGSFYTIKEIWSPVYIPNYKIDRGKFDGKLAVENRYLYTNLSQVKFNCKLIKLAAPNAIKKDPVVLFQRNFNGSAIAPGQQGQLNLQLPADYNKADVLYLTATDPYGRELFTWSWPLKTAEQVFLAANNEVNKGGAVTFSETDGTLAVKASGVEIMFNKQTGLITNVKNAKSAISFTNGPVLAAGTTRFQSLRHYKNGNEYVIEMNYSGDMKKATFTMLSSGILKLDYSYLPGRRDGNGFDYLGISFNYPEEKITGLRYLGRGPYRVWKNRMKGGQFNIWEKKYNNTITGESWEYPEFKGYYRDFNWVVIENKESPFIIYSGTENLFLRLYTPPKPKGAGNENTSPPFPEGDISFLNGISAIGTKFDHGEVHGPQSQKNRVGSEWIRNTLYFDFR